jgi:hypothetical protein
MTIFCKFSCCNIYHNDNKGIVIFIKTQSLVMHIKTKNIVASTFKIYICVIGIARYVLI